VLRSRGAIMKVEWFLSLKNINSVERERERERALNYVRPKQQEMLGQRKQNHILLILNV